MRVLLLAAAAWAAGAQPVLEHRLTGVGEGPAGATFSADGATITVGTTGRGSVRFDARTGVPLPAGEAKEAAAGPGDFPMVSTDGKRVLQVGDGRVRIYEAGGSRLVSSVAVAGEVAAAARDHSRLVVWTDRGLVLLDPRTGRRIATLRHGPERAGARFSADGRWLVTFAEFTAARVWDARSGRPAGTLGKRNASFVAMAPDRPVAAIAIGDGTVELWRLQ